MKKNFIICDIPLCIPLCDIPLQRGISQIKIPQDFFENSEEVKSIVLSKKGILKYQQNPEIPRSYFLKRLRISGMGWGGYDL